MRITDWSSDVCSSDLANARHFFDIADGGRIYVSDVAQLPSVAKSRLDRTAADPQPDAAIHRNPFTFQALVARMEFVARLRIQKEDMIVEWQHQTGVDGGTEFHLLLPQSALSRPRLARPSSIAVIDGGPSHIDLQIQLFLRRCRYSYK